MAYLNGNGNGKSTAVAIYRGALMVALAILGWALSSMWTDINKNLDTLSKKIDNVTVSEASTKATLDAHGQRLDHIETRLDTLEK